MSLIREFLTELEAKGIKFWLQDERLHYGASKGVVTVALRAKMVQRKKEIIAFLQEAEQFSGHSLIQTTHRKDKMPLSFAQQRLWFLDQLHGTSAYNMPLVLNLKGVLNVTALHQTLQTIVQRHESLRTTFSVDKTGAPYQVIHSEMSIDLPVINLSGYSTEEKTREVIQHTNTEAIHPFDLSRNPMLRATLLCLHDNDYLLLLTLHHIAADGWSLGILVEELATLYEAFSQTMPSPLTELPIQYVDFTVWQQDYLQGEKLTQQLDYWKKRLVDAPALLQLPTDRPRPAQQSFQGSEVTIRVGDDLTQQLRHLSQTQNSTLYMTLLAAFHVLMHRYSGQSDVVVASPIANRNRQEIEGLIGFFVNTLALRATLLDSDGQPLSYLDLLTQIQETTQAAYDHQDLPFERLVEELQPARDLNYNPLVQVVFALQNAPKGDFHLPGLTVTTVESEVQMTRFDLELYIWEEENHLQGSCIYNTDLFDKQTIERMMGHFQTLLTGIVNNPQCSIAKLPLLSVTERHHVLVQYNDTCRDYPKDKCIHQLFEEQTERTPTATAVLFDNRKSIQAPQSLQSLTYCQLNERSNQLSHYLIGLGVSPETIIGVCVERSLEMVISILAILKAGAAYLPLDPDYPQDRLAFMLADAQPSFLLTQTNQMANLPKQSIASICLDEKWAEIATLSQANPVSHVMADNLAYVIYTSGSTGEPKGVELLHRGLCNVSEAQVRTFELTANDKILQFSSLNFDAATFEIVMALRVGATLCLGTKEILAPGKPLIDFLIRHQISQVTLTPSTLAVLPREALPALHTITVAGETCPAELVKKWGKNHRFFNLYGPTESTIWATAQHCKVSISPPLIGSPIANTQTYILDPFGQPTPIGVSGELHIGGVGVARGYLNRPELTQKKFIPNIFREGQLYKTGDLARWLEGGKLEFLGRIDHQVKLRGFRIELGEIETTLTDYPTIKEAIVLTHEEHSDNKQLVGYLVADVAQEIQTEHVEQWQNLYEESYAQSSDEKLSFNLKGWNSSYTGDAIPEKEMAEWVTTTVDEIRSLRPTKIWEIGCGTGLLLSRLAPNCITYWATDYSNEALQQAAQLIKKTSLNHVLLSQRMADDVTGIEADQFDCVIINSVVQYFPSVDYLLTVLKNAVRAVKPGGTVYVGDVRNLRLLSAYHTAVQLYQANDDLSLTQLQRRIQQRLQDEEELLIDPDFFYALCQHLPEIDRVEIKLKNGHFHNELTQFRYQVMLHIVPAKEKKADNLIDYRWRWNEEDWSQQGWTIDSLLEHLRFTKKSKDALLIRNIPNARVQNAVETLALLGDVIAGQTQIKNVKQCRDLLSTMDNGIDPEALWSLAKKASVQIHITWSETLGMMDACFIPYTDDKTIGHFSLPFASQAYEAKPWANYTNNPLLGKLNRTLLPKVRAWLQQKLPDYMIPSALVLLDAIPLTPNGKVDFKALPSPVDLHQVNEGNFVSPRTPTEIILSDIWLEILGIKKIGIHNNFFELGGHSLLATQIVSRISTLLTTELSLRALFETPTIAGLAERIDELNAVKKLHSLHSKERLLTTERERIVL